MSETCSFEIDSIKGRTVKASLSLCHPDESFAWVSPAAVACLLNALLQDTDEAAAERLQRAGFGFDQEADRARLKRLNDAAKPFIASVKVGRAVHARVTGERPGESLLLERDDSGEDPVVPLELRMADATLLKSLKAGQRVHTIQGALGELPVAQKKIPAAKIADKKSSKKAGAAAALSIRGAGERCSLLSFSADGSLVAAAESSKTFLIARTDDGSARTFELDCGPDARIAGLAFLGAELAVAWQTGMHGRFGVVLYDAAGVALAKTKPVKYINNGVAACVASADQQLLALSTSGEKTWLWKAGDLRAGKPGKAFGVGTGAGSPLGFSGSNELLVALGDDDLTQIAAITSSGKVSRTETDLMFSDRLTSAGDVVCLIGGSCLAQCTVMKKGAVLATWTQTFQCATVSPDKLIGASGTHASIKRGTNWKTTTDAARASGFLGAVDLKTGKMSKVIPLNLKGANGMVFAVALSPGRFVAVGLDNEVRLFPWSLVD